MSRTISRLICDRVANAAAALLRMAASRRHHRQNPWDPRRHFSRRIIVLVALALGICASIAAAAADGLPSPCRPELALSADQISQRLAANNAERAQHLRHFEGERHYALDYNGFPSERSAEMLVNASYQAPGTKRFSIVSVSGSKLIISHVFHRLLESEQESSADEKQRDAVALTSDNYRFALRGCAAVAGRDLYVLDVQPLRDNKFLYRGSIWIDTQDFAVVRIEAEPARNPSFWTKHSQIHHQYRKIGEFYLPSLNRTVTETRFGGRAVLTIRYERYQLDTSAGLRIVEY